MNLKEAEQQLNDQLAQVYESAEAVAICNMVMQHLTGWARRKRRLDNAVTLGEDQVQHLQQMTSHLLLHRPVQYVIGRAWFYNMELKVNEAVLIPRPETEELVEWVLNEKTERKDGEILDIGTGSGCIPIAIKKNWPEANLFAMDVSEAALEVAKANAMLQQTPIAFLHADILNESSWPAENFDIIISNPPYIPQQERQLLDKHVTEWEPHLALFVPANDPLMFYRKIGTFAKQHLSPGGVLYFECHQQFASLVVAILEKQGFTANLKQDLFGNDRMVRARVNQH